jgi:hypothetical protein
MGSCATSRRQAPTATAATRAARTIAFFISIPLKPTRGLSELLASNLRGSRNFSAELHGLMRNFATAGSHSHSRDDRRHNDRALHNLHVFSPDAYSAIAFTGLPVSPLQIKKRGGFPTAFPTLRCENATPDQHDSHAPLTCHETPGQAAATCRLAARNFSAGPHLKNHERSKDPVNGKLIFAVATMPGRRRTRASAIAARCAPSNRSYRV